MMKITVDLIKNYQEYLNEEEKSRSTIEKYIRDISAFKKWVGDMELSKIKVLDYKKELVEKYTPATVNSILAALNSFFDYNEWYCLKVKSLKLQHALFCQKDKELSKHEYERLLKAAKDKRKHVDEKFSKLGLSLHYLISFRVWHISTLKKDLH